MNWTSVYIQKLIPHHFFTKTMGKLARIRTPWLKNWMINRFINKYNVDMSLAVLENAEQYPDFNTFFIRQLKPELRPITQTGIACPVDGTISQIGTIHKNELLQAKNFYYDLKTLLGGDSKLAEVFNDGSFATLYLAPRDYHRIHMPLSGKLLKTIYVPGKLFSVNKITSELIPNLYSRNERLISIFETEVGKMAVVLVGAMIVGNIQTVWMTQPLKANQVQTTIFTKDIELQSGAELGHFKLGSTVILLFEKNAMTWDKSLNAGTVIKFGQFLGNLHLMH